MSELIIALTTGLIGMLGWGLADYFNATGMKKGVSEEAANFWVNFSGIIFIMLLLPLGSRTLNAPLEMPPLGGLQIIKIIGLSAMAFVAYLFFFKALKLGSLSVISTVFSTYAAGAVLVSVFLFGEQLSALKWVALAIVIIGVIFVSITNLGNFKKAKGVLWAIPAVLIFSFFFPMWDQVANQGGSLVLTLLIDTTLAIMYFFWARAKGKKLAYKIKSLKPIFWAGIATSFAALAVSWGYQHTSLTSIVSVVSSAVPVTSAFLGYFFLKERLTKLQYVGVLAIVVGGVLLFL